MQLTTDAQHDEINLYRLVRRLEKSAQLTEEWEEREGQTDTDIWFKAQKDLQKVKYARKLIKSVELYDMDGSRDRTQKLNELKIQVDRLEQFLRDQELRHAQPPKRPPSLLSQIPIPTPAKVPSPSEDSVQEGDDSTPHSPRSPRSSPSSSPRPSKREQQRQHFATTDSLLLLSPPDADGLPLPSAGLASAIPALMSAEPIDSPVPYRPSFAYASSSSVAVASGSSASGLSSSTAGPRKPYQSQAHTALHEELSVQLEHMAAQLKRNAMHFADSLVKDKSVVEDAGEKLERNHEVLLKERSRLGVFGAKSGGTTWLTMGIVLVVLLLFMAMVSVIRFSRF